MQKRNCICILTGNHLCHNPRVIKEATALAAAGYEVEVLGAWSDRELKDRDREITATASFAFAPVIDLTEAPGRSLVERSKSKAAQLIHQMTGFENHRQLGFAVGALTKTARQSKADLLIAHSEMALFAISQLRKGAWLPQSFTFSTPSSELRTSRPAFGIDMEDWYSEDLPPEARKNRPTRLLHKLEATLATKAVYMTCPSDAMANALAQTYRCNPPLVIYNAFPWKDRESIDGLTKDRRDTNVPSLLWYSQTLGSGRGLEDLVAALPFVQDECEIHLRGKAIAGFRDWLAGQIPDKWRSHVFLHDVVSNHELLSRIAEHDIGFAGEQKYCQSRNLTVTNKILHYLLGGLAVVASDTLGQREVAEQAPEAVRIYRAGDASSLAEELNTLLGDRSRLRIAKKAALAAAEQTFCWETQEPKLLRSIEAAMQND